MTHQSAFLLIFCFVHLGTATSTQHPDCRARGGGFNDTSMALSLRPLSAYADALCQDGSPAALYVRQCCNGPDPGDWCNHTQVIPTWLVVFGDGNNDGWCWDAASCAARAREFPALTTSSGLPHFFSRDGDNKGEAIGAFSKSGEGNPNFYPSYAAYVPYCSSDLFVGNSTSREAPHFRGQAIALAALTALSRDMHASAASAPGKELNVVIVGGAGIMTQLSQLRAVLPSAAKVTAVCDGCVLFDDESADRALSANPTQQDRNRTGNPCNGGDAYSCLPRQTLPQAVKLWSALDAFGLCLDGWRCLLDAPARLVAAHNSTPLLAQQPLYDGHAISSHTEKTPSAVRARITKALSSAHVIVGSACSTPSAAFTRSAFNYVTFGGGLPPLSFSTAVNALVRGGKVQLLDTCEGINCNPSCTPAMIE
ncbi:hypothetical protein CYMTET_15311 [Cymbomonas tetramitiformis]|uniref:Pectin acetylesterase n=1 Tax=Cymbomonas tetramitiformis TaxID=36881 RepID=A0AAE0L918_9CHLO|nr:hypothetical protein CYMTET_15311 [Cymbomonas tetramitiformis]